MLTASILAQLPETGYYFNPYKLGIFFLFAFAWFASWAWVDADASKVRTNPFQWSALMGVSGLVGTLAWLFVPLWWIGLLIFAVCFGPAIMAYVSFRNKRVAPSETVLTSAHYQRLMTGKKETDEATHKLDKVRIKGADGKYPAWPTDPAQHEAYQALQDLIFDIVWRRASDVEVQLMPQQARIFYKVDGVVRERDAVMRPLSDVVLQQLKKIAGMNPDELRKPQQGKLTATIGVGGAGDKTVDVMISSFGSTTAHRVQMRTVAAESRFRVNELGLTKEQLEVVEPLGQEQQGLVVCCGTKESGLSSTLYAFIRGHDAFMWNIHTIEKSRVMEVENVTQHSTDKKNDIPVARQIQSIFRTDPDIVMVGDANERDVAVLSTEFSQSKRVYIGLNANDTMDGLRKLMETVGDNALVARSIKVILAQRLVRRICPNCRKGYRPDVNLLKKANLPIDQNRVFYRPPNRNEIEVDKQGNQIICGVCQGSGYLGRTGVFELLPVDDIVRDLIARGAPLAKIKEQARKNRMLYLQEIGLLKVFEGVTSINEVLRVTGDGKQTGGEAA